MLAILYALGMFVAGLIKSRSRLEAENLFLRHQLNLALRQKPTRLRLQGSDRCVYTKLFPFLGTSALVSPCRFSRRIAPCASSSMISTLYTLPASSASTAA